MGEQPSPIYLEWQPVLIMEYPRLLNPTTTEALQIPSGNFIYVPKANVSFALWDGKVPGDTYGGKVVLKFENRPVFAELAVLRIFLREGWTGVWVDTYRNKFRTDYWPANEVQLPAEAQELLEATYRKAGSDKGCWDVYCWKDNLSIFVECKARGKDRIRDTQRRWFSSAIQSGVPLDSFLVVEWSPSHNGLPS